MRCGPKSVYATWPCSPARDCWEASLEEPRLVQLFAEPIVTQFMRRDGIDEATIRRLLRLAAAARVVPSAPPRKGLLAFVMGSPLLAGIRHAWDSAVWTIRGRRC